MQQQRTPRNERGDIRYAQQLASVVVVVVLAVDTHGLKAGKIGGNERNKRRPFKAADAIVLFACACLSLSVCLYGGPFVCVRLSFHPLPTNNNNLCPIGDASGAAGGGEQDPRRMGSLASRWIKLKFHLVFLRILAYEEISGAP